MADGKIRSWGLSNFDQPIWRRRSASPAPGRIACNQVYYQLEERGIEHRVIPWCEAHGVAVVAYSPFGSGDFPAPRTRAGGCWPTSPAPTAPRRGRWRSPS